MEFAPGDIIRMGRDNAVSVRGIDGSWLDVSIGYAAKTEPHSLGIRWMDDTVVSERVESGAATLIYKSIGHYDTSTWDEDPWTLSGLI